MKKSIVYLFAAVLFLHHAVASPQTTHSADKNGNFLVDLSELLRVIQFFNVGALHCDAAGEDGFNPGVGLQLCDPHHSDYNPQNWIIGLAELLRLIQFFNVQSYYHCPGVGEDDFCPGTDSGEGEGEGEGEGSLPLPDLGVNANLNGWRPFGAGDEWNRPVDSDEVAANSDALIDYYGRDKTLRIDAGNTEDYYGIPYVVVGGTQPMVTIEYGTYCNGEGLEDYVDESDLGPMPIPLDAPIEGASIADPDPTCGDRHVLVIDRDNMMLYELYKTIRIPGGFRCASSAIWDLAATNNVRPAGWTSADAGGMPIFPGLLKYEEAASGEINHALRVTVRHVRRAYTYPGNHFGPYSIDERLAYGQRLRLKASFDETPYSGATLAIIKALKKYGLIVADQGSDWYISGVTHSGWSGVRSVIQSITADNLEVLEPVNPLVIGYAK